MNTLKNGNLVTRSKYLTLLITLLLVFNLVTPQIPATAEESSSVEDVYLDYPFSDSDLANYDSSKLGFRYSITKLSSGDQPGEVQVDSLYIPYKSNILDRVLHVPSQVYFSGKTYLVTSIKNEAFDNSNIDEIYLPSTIRSIGKSAFLRSTIQKIALPTSLEVIDEYAFAFCYNLKEIDLDSNNQNFISDGKFLYTKDGKTLITSINLTKSVTIKDGVENILDCALSNCAYWKDNKKYNLIEEMIFPSSIKYIGIENLRASLLTFKGTIPPSINDNLDYNTFAIVPKSCREKYKKLKFEGAPVFEIGCLHESSEYYSSNKKFLKRLNFKKYTAKTTNKSITTEVAKITSNSKNDYDKAMAIYEYFLENYRVNSSAISNSKTFEKDKIKNVIKNKYGSITGISNLATEFFRAADIPALTVSQIEKADFYNCYASTNLVYIDKSWHIIDIPCAIHDISHKGTLSIDSFENPYTHFYMNLKWFSTTSGLYYVSY